MTNREQLLDQLGLVFAHAAVDRLLAERDVIYTAQKNEGPASANREALRSSSTKLPDDNLTAAPPGRAT